MSQTLNRTPDPVDVQVGQRICLVREQAGLTQADLGNAIGVTFQQVQKYEKGTNRVSASKLFEMAEFMKVGIPFFFDGYSSATVGVAEEAPAFDHEHRPTKTSVEITRLAPRLPARKQKLILDMMRDMLGDDDTQN